MILRQNPDKFCQRMHLKAALAAQKRLERNPNDEKGRRVAMWCWSATIERGHVDC